MRRASLIQCVTQAVPNEVDRQHGERQEKTGEEHDPEGDLHVAPSLSHDVPPTGNLRRRASAEKTEIGFKNHRRGTDVRAPAQ